VHGIEKSISMHFFYFNGYRPVTIQGGICVQKERKIKYGGYKTVYGGK
jgi:hypothetical protein